MTSYNKGFTEILKKAIQKCHENDIEFVLCSGRPTVTLINIAAMLKDDGVHLRYIAGFNGCEIYDLVNEKYIHQELLVDPNTVVEQLKIVDVDYLMYHRNIIYSSNVENEFSIREGISTKLKVKILTHIPKTPKIVALVHPDNMDKVLEQLKLKIPEYTIVKLTPFFMDITINGSDKGSGLLKMAELLDVSLDQVVCLVMQEMT